MYTIGEVSEMFNLPVSTLRYYDKEGLLPDLQRVSGMRRFSDKTVETLQVIECLKKSGMEIKDIKGIYEMVLPGQMKPIRSGMKCSCVKERKAEREIRKLEKVLDMINTSFGTMSRLWLTETRIEYVPLCRIKCLRR